MKFALILSLFVSQVCFARYKTMNDVSYSLKNSHYYLKVKKDGTHSGHHSLSYEILKESGRDKFSLYKLPYNSATTMMKVTEAKVVNGADSQVVSPDKIVDRFVGKDHGIDSGKEIQIAFPQVQVGSIVNIEYDIVISQVPVPGHFSMTSFIGQEGFSHQDSLHVESELPLDAYLNDPQRGLKSEESIVNGVYNLKISQTKPILAGVVEENSVLPPEQLTYIYVTSDKDWNLIGSTFQKNFEASLGSALPKELEEAVKSAAKLKTLDAKVNHLVTYIVKNFNYVGDWRTLNGGFSPRKMEEIMSTKYGDCKDFATVLTAMLRKLSVTAHVGLVHRSHPAYGRYQNPKKPSVDMFNHAIVRVQAEGKTYWIDPTNKTSFGLRHRADISGKYALALDEKKQIEYIPISHNGVTTQIVKVVKLESENKGTVASSVILDGEVALLFTGLEEAQGKDVMNKIFLGVVSQGEKSVIPEITPYDLKTREFKKIKVGLKYSGHDFSSKSNNETYLNLPNLGTALAPLAQNFDNWKGDLYLGTPQKIIRSLVVKGAFVKERPRACRAKSQWFDVTRKFKLLPDGVRVNDEIHIKTSFIPSAAFKTTDFDVLSSDIYNCYRLSSIPFYFGKKHEAPSAEIHTQFAKLSVSERVQKRFELAEAIWGDENEEYTRDDALDLLKKNIKEDPKHADSYALLAQMTLRQGYFNGSNYSSTSIKESYRILQKGLVQIPDHSGIKVYQAFVKTIEKKNDEALEIINQVPLENLKTLNDFLRLSRIYSNLGDSEKTISTLKLAESKAKNDFQKGSVNFELGTFYSTVKDHDNCIKYYNKTLELKPKDNFTYINVTNCYRDSKRFDEAIEVAKKGRALYDKGMINRVLSMSLIGRGENYLKNNQLDLAEKDLIDSFEYEKFYYAFEHLAKVMISKNEPKRAFSIYVEGSEFSKNKYLYFLRAGRAFEKFPDSALAIYEHAMKTQKHPMSTMEFLNRMAQIYNKLNRNAEARMARKEAIAIGEAVYERWKVEPDYLISLGALYAFSDDPKLKAKGLVFLNEAKKLKPDHEDLPLYFGIYEAKVSTKEQPVRMPASVQK